MSFMEEGIVYPLHRLRKLQMVKKIIENHTHLLRIMYLT